MLFSVIIPVYNIRDYLHKCLKSVLSQNFKDYELILVDDGSTDGSSSICDEYAQNDSRIRVIHKENGGVVSARNIGIKEARGEYILYVDGDDWVSENWMEVISARINSAPEKPDIVVFGSTAVYNDRQIPHIINTSEGFYDKIGLETRIFPRLIDDKKRDLGDAIILPAPWNKAYKRNLLEKHHCFNERINLGEDNAFVFECFLNAQSVVICKDTLYFYNKLNLNSMQSKPDTNRFKKRLRLFQYIQTRLAPYNSVIGSQMDTFYASRIILDITCMYKNTTDLKKSARHLKEELKTTGILKYVHVLKTSFRAGIIILLLKMGLCRTVLFGLRKLKKI